MDRRGRHSRGIQEHQQQDRMKPNILMPTMVCCECQGKIREETQLVIHPCILSCPQGSVIWELPESIDPQKIQLCTFPKGHYGFIANVFLTCSCLFFHF